MDSLIGKIFCSMIIHILWYVCVAYFALSLEWGNWSPVTRFFGLSDYAIYSTPVYLLVVYIFEILVYKYKPLVSTKDKKIFWIVTAIFSIFMAVPMIWSYFL